MVSRLRGSPDILLISVSRVALLRSRVKSRYRFSSLDQQMLGRASMMGTHTQPLFALTLDAIALCCARLAGINVKKML
jgi:hypothetical protein